LSLSARDTAGIMKLWPHQIVKITIAMQRQKILMFGFLCYAPSLPAAGMALLADSLLSRLRLLPKPN
jgi:hypothetical protein